MRPPSTVFSRCCDLCLTAHPTCGETKSSCVTSVKNLPGRIVVHRCPPSLVTNNASFSFTHPCSISAKLLGRR